MPAGVAVAERTIRCRREGVRGPATASNATSRRLQTAFSTRFMLTVRLTQGRVRNGPPASFEIVLGEAPGRLAVTAEVDGNAPIHADGNGRPENRVGMRARAAVAFEHIAQRPLDHDAGEFAARQLPQLGVEPFSGADGRAVLSLESGVCRIFPCDYTLPFCSGLKSSDSGQTHARPYKASSI